MLKLTTNRRYQRVTLRGAGCPAKIAMVHHVVAAAFISRRPEGLMVLHRNGKSHDNRASNLYYGTASDNMRDKIEHGNNFQVEKDTCPRGHALTGYNLDPSVLHRSRTCLSCHKAWCAAHVPGRTVSWELLADRIYPIVSAGEWPTHKGEIWRLMARLL